MLLIEQTIGAASANANNRNGFASNRSNCSEAKNRRPGKSGLGTKRASTFHNNGSANIPSDVGRKAGMRRNSDVS